MEDPSELSLSKKIFFTCIVTTVFLVFVELGLRLTGWYMAELRKVEVKPDVKVIVCLGDSYVYGIWVGEEKTFPAQLQKIIDDHGGGYQVINLGIPGQNSAQILSALPRIIKRYHPDLALVLVGHNSFCNGAGHEKHLYLRYLHKLKLAKIIQVVKIQYIDRNPLGLVYYGRHDWEPLVVQGYPENTHENNAKELVQDLERIVKLCRDNRLEPVLINYPGCASRKNKWLGYVNSIIGQVSREKGVPLVDSESFFCDRYKASGVYDGKLRDQMQFSDGHPRPPGYTWMAENTYEVLKSVGILK